MAGWDSFYDGAEKFADLAYGPKPVTPATIDTSIEPPLVAPVSAAQEQQAAGLVMPQATPQVAPWAPVSVPQPQAQPQAVLPQPGMVPLQQTVTQNTISPMAKSEQRLAGMAVDDALQSKANADIAANNAAVEESRAKAAYLQRETDETAALNAKRLQEASEKRAAVETAAQARDSFEFNPNRVHQRMGVGGQILATIGQAFGAFGAAITHSPNYAQQMIDRAINADLQSQENEYKALGARVDSRRNDFAAFRQQGMDDDAARTATRLLRLQQAAAKYDELTAGTKNAQIQATTNQLRALNQQKQADVAAEYEKRQVTTTSQNPAASANPGAQLPANESEKLGTANAAIKAAQENYKDWDKSARGVYGYITSFLPATDAASFEDKRAMTKQIIGSYLEGGVLRKEDEAKYDKYLPVAGESQDRALGKRDKLIALIASRAEEQRKAHKQAGFNVDQIKINKPVSTFKPVE